MKLHSPSTTKGVRTTSISNAGIMRAKHAAAGHYCRNTPSQLSMTSKNGDLITNKHKHVNRTICSTVECPLLDVSAMFHFSETCQGEK